MNLEDDLSLWDVVVNYVGSIQLFHKGVAGILLACKYSVVGDPDFNCDEITPKESDELSGLVVGTAIMRELSQPQRNRYGLNILFGSKRYEKST